MTPNMPRLETVKVPPESSGGVIVPSRTLPARARASVAISRRPLRSASKTVGTTSASCGGDGDADVDPRVELEAPVLVGAVGPRELAQRQRAGLDDHVVERGHDLALGGQRLDRARVPRPPRSCRSPPAGRSAAPSPSTPPSAARPPAAARELLVGDLALRGLRGCGRPLLRYPRTGLPLSGGAVGASAPSACPVLGRLLHVLLHDPPAGPGALDGRPDRRPSPSPSARRPATL